MEIVGIMLSDRFEKMSSQELDAEIHRMTNLFFKQRPGTQMHTQLVLAIDEARRISHDKHRIEDFKNRVKDENPNAPLEIGTIEENIYTPSYTNSELIIEVAKTYTKDKNPDEQ
jgi:hypothetical protein